MISVWIGRRVSILTFESFVEIIRRTPSRPKVFDIYSPDLSAEEIMSLPKENIAWATRETFGRG